MTTIGRLRKDTIYDSFAFVERRYSTDICEHKKEFGLFACNNINEGVIVTCFCKPILLNTEAKLAFIESKYPFIPADSYIHVASHNISVWDSVFAKGSRPDWYMANHSEDGANILLTYIGGNIQLVTKCKVLKDSELKYNYKNPDPNWTLMRNRGFCVCGSKL
jgi:hypothetical protein